MTLRRRLPPWQAQASHGPGSGTLSLAGRAGAPIAALALAILSYSAVATTERAHAALPSDAAGVPFVTFAHAVASGDYALACKQMSVAAIMRRVTPRLPTLGAARAACAEGLAAEAADLDDGRLSSLASTRVVAVRVLPGRARVTVQTTLYGFQPRSTGTAVFQFGRWAIAGLPAKAHVGSALVEQIPSETMLPTLRLRDTVLVDTTAYRHQRPRLGDIVVFRPPAGAERVTSSCGRRPPAGQACAVAIPRVLDVLFIKRIVALPGDRISIRGGRMVRNGRRAQESFITPCLMHEAGCHFPRTFTVPRGRYYLLGDNRGASDDSRYWGPVAAAQIVGRAQRIGP